MQVMLSDICDQLLIDKVDEMAGGDQKTKTYDMICKYLRELERKDSKTLENLKKAEDL